jgi:hypothetical protein
LRRAVEQIHKTMSLNDPPTVLPMALQSAKGMVAVTKTRCVLIPALNGVGGARCIGILAFTPFELLPVDCLTSVLPKVAAAVGKDLAAFNLFPAVDRP